MVADSPLLRPVKEGNTFEQTVERLASAIRLGVVETGQRLPPERELADQLRVSRVTLREAIKALQQAGYVTVTRGRTGGTVVVYDPRRRKQGDAKRIAESLGASEVLDALAYRSVVEPGAAELAASRTLDPAEKERLRESLAAATDCDAAIRRVCDSRYHLLIAELSGSPTLAAAVAEVQGRLDALLGAIPVFARNIAHSDQHHARIAKAIIAGRSATARTVMAEHVEATAALLRGLLT
jgi:DNA-binding FadR family transcriptional regulator